ncbi:NAD(P)H-dependent oxidoreductase [Pseudaminobacter arsenicus]|uniref:NAD(P)H-dependent oxidoreductase n=2 Tax=Borborobacter arsenicus TaxID=1851146 RepID=A0A432V4U8_9HYPH|nr:NAD(P)H-dependent oxidoreductase [Pseudaminobacter arsenicus]
MQIGRGQSGGDGEVGPLRVAVLVGSARQGSLNRSLALAMMRLGDDRLAFDVPALDELPLFNQSVLEAGMPQPVARLQSTIQAADGVLIVTPEHNRSITALLKNALDWLSRPAGANSWTGKPVAIAGASAGRLGTVAAQQHLRAILGYLDMPTMGQPEVYLQLTASLITPEGDITDESTKAFLQGYMHKFHHWVRTHRRVDAPALG